MSSLNSRDRETLYWTEFDTLVGTMRIASGQRGILLLGLPLENGREFSGWMKRHAPKARLVDITSWSG